MAGKASKPTISDIARLAGVSKATVSRVLNDKPDVDGETRERILRIIDEQGFVPSIAAAGLASGRRQLIGMLIPSFAWPLIPELMRGVADMLEETSYELVLYCINEGDRKRDRGKLIECVSPPSPWVSHVEIAFHAFQQDLPVGDNTQNVGTCQDCRPNGCRQAGRFRQGNQRGIGIEEVAPHRSPVRKRSASTGAVTFRRR